MRYINSVKVSPKTYELTLEVSENDMEMLEDLATTYAPFKLYDEHRSEFGFDFSDCDFNDKFGKWLMKTWRTFWMLWKTHDEENEK